MAVELGSKVLFLRDGACCVEGPSQRPFYLERWEILLNLGVDQAYARWLTEPLEDDIRA